MAVDEKHPLYGDYIADWTLMRDCASGERTVKFRSETYLPCPSGFKTQDDKGVAMYTAYQTRAQYPDILQPTLQGMVGVIHRVDSDITGLEEGKPLESLWEKCTLDGLTLEDFHRQITTEILLTGRYSILTDVASGENATTTNGSKPGVPYFTGYSAEQLINWSDPDRDLFVLDETNWVRGTQTTLKNEETGKEEIVGDEFSWTEQLKYRVLRLKDGNYTAQVYNLSVFSEEEEVTPQLKGAKNLTEIPLVVVGPRSASMTLDPPPLVGVAKAALAIYRLDADYRHQLFWSGQETCFIIGTTENLPKVLGAGCTYGLPEGCSVQYAGAAGRGIEAHRQAILDERQNAVAAGVKLFDSQKAAESGEALRLRAAAQTATLTTVALASAAALERALRYAAMFVGQDPTEIVVKANTEFVETRMTPQEAQALVGVWQSGAISRTSLHEDLQRGGIVSSERTVEEELDLINQEAMAQPMAPEMAGGMGGPMGGLEGLMAGGGPPPGSLNGSAALMQQIPSRFIEDGTGLVIEEA